MRRCGLPGGQGTISTAGAGISRDLAASEPDAMALGESGLANSGKRGLGERSRKGAGQCSEGSGCEKAEQSQVLCQRVSLKKK